jgi:hypothetical protein
MSEETQTTVVTAPADATVGVKVTPAHEQSLTSRTDVGNVKVEIFYPDHTPRASDPQYGLFDRARKAMIAAGCHQCWRCGATEEESGHPLECHHTHIEYALANSVDPSMIAEKVPEWHVTDEATLLQFLEGPGNLTMLCLRCHRGAEAVHFLPAPVWEPGRFSRKLVAQVVNADESHN